MARLLFATVLLAVCVSYASASWGPWVQKNACYCRGNEGRGTETFRRECYSECGSGPSYEEDNRVCYCVDEPVLSPGEIAGIVVGAVVFLILIIICIIWCFYCGCDCDDRGHGPRRWHSDESIYRGRVVQAPPPTIVAGPHLHAPVVQQFTPAPVTYAVPAPKPVTFATSVVQQAPMMHQHGAVYAKPQQQSIQYVMQ